MRPKHWILLAAAGPFVLLGLLEPAAPRVDFGALRVVVLHSDDWGLEAWFPDARRARTLTVLTEGLREGLSVYATSGLETAEDVTRLSAALGAYRDLDGLPAVLQANHVVAGPDLPGAADLRLGWRVHPSGRGSGPYARPGLDAAVDAAIEAGTWWPELHGLTHFDLHRYARSRAEGDPLAGVAAAESVFAHSGWIRASELDDADPDRARTIAGAARDRFVERFGRPPRSVIAPDYRWGPEDERAWREQGIEVVQAKREQVDLALSPHTLLGRAKKWIGRQWDRRRPGAFYVDRSADLEPYGDPDPAAVQGAGAALASIHAAWREGRPGVVSIHRAQLVNFDGSVSAAGHAQLLALLDGLREGGGARFLVDAELRQLHRRGWSSLRRGGLWIVRNHTAGPVRCAPEGGPARDFPPGTTVLREAGTGGGRTLDNVNFRMDLRP